jgi:hypothetical protein
MKKMREDFEREKEDLKRSLMEDFEKERKAWAEERARLLQRIKELEDRIKELEDLLRQLQAKFDKDLEEMRTLRYKEAEEGESSSFFRTHVIY